MALSKKVIFNDGISVDNAYIKITSVSGNKDCLTIEVSTFISKNAADILHLQPRTIKYYAFAPAIGSNVNDFIAQGYLYLKSLDEFKDATDC